MLSEFDQSWGKFDQLGPDVRQIRGEPPSDFGPVGPTFVVDAQ